MYEKINELLIHLRAKKPLILNLSNLVTMNFIANGLLSLGASPLMSQAIEELEDLITISDALVINIGTLNPEFIKCCRLACRFANDYQKPIIFDPVGVGASRYRSITGLELLEEFKFAIIRGNGSEIMALAGESQNTKGVDSSIGSEAALENAKYLAKKYETTLVVSGQTDLVVNALQVQCFDYGSPLMPQVTGSGCLLSAVTAAFHSICSDAFLASSSAVVFYGLCGEKAAKKAEQPGSFAVHFLDALACLM